MANTITIKNETTAWQILEMWLADKPIDFVEFEHWPLLNIKISGDSYSSSLNTGQMAALVEFKKTMGRAYASIAHGAYDARRLRTYKEEQLEFSTELKKGSSLAETNYTSLVDAFAQIISIHPNLSIAAAIVMGLTFVSKPIILKFLENRSKQIDATERMQLVSLVQSTTDEDRKRWTIMEQAIAKICQSYPQFAQVIPDASAAYWRLAGSAANADSMEISGIKLSKKQLEALSERRTVRNAELEDITDEFQVIGIVKIQNSYRVQLKSKTTHLSAIFRSPEMTPVRVKKLMTCMTDSQTIDATVELKTVDGSQVVGRLMKFTLRREPRLETGS